MKSIQSRLMGGLAGVLLLTSLLTGGGLCLWLRHTLIEDFDRSLSLRAAMLSSLVTVGRRGELEVESDLLPGSIHQKRHGDEYVQFDDGQDTPLFSTNPDARLASPAREGKPYDLRLPGGRPGRAIARWFEPAYEDGEGLSAASKPALRPPRVRVIVARDRHELDETISDVVAAVIAGTLLLTVVAVGASVWIVRRGLSGLRDISQRVAGIDAAQPVPGFVDASQPAELLPIATRLDELINRVAQTLNRERQFSVAVSHELRTPIAELLVVTELALRDPDDVELMTRAIRESHQIGTEMQQLVSTLLEVSRLGHSGRRLPAEPVNVDEIVAASIQKYSTAFTERQLIVDYRRAAAVAEVHRNALRVVVDNLVCNAARYAVPGTQVLITVAPNPTGVELSIRNQQDQLTPADVGHLFDPFWQKDPARSGIGVGLGLTLVRAYVGAMGASVRADLEGTGVLVMTCVLPHPSTQATTTH